MSLAPTPRERAWLLALATLAACRPGSSSAIESRPPPESEKPKSQATSASPRERNELPAPTLPNVKTDWCLEDFQALDQGTCYLTGDRPTRLLIYLSGIVPPTATSPQKEKVQRIVSAAARRQSGDVAVLLPRGRRGIGPKDAKDWWAWPTGPVDYARYSKELVAEWTASRARLEVALGHPFSRTYLAGSSSGAYFIAALASSGTIDMDGYAAASGGAPAALTAGAVKRPFYVGYATGDPTNGGPKALAIALSRAGWPVLVGEHPGGHGARQEYLDEAFAFWSTFEVDSGPR